MSTPILSLQHVQVNLGGNKVLNDMHFSLAKGAIGCLLGESGCGKTTLLRSIAGFENIAAGSISLQAEIVAQAASATAKAQHLPPEKRRVGLMFQDFALFPHLNVAENIAFGLHQLEVAGKKARVKQLLQLVGLENFAMRYIDQLSGGQQQRVALARAIAAKPRLILLDEPFSQLDQSWRESLALHMREILKSEGVSALMVTHHYEEPLIIADMLGVMEDGKLLQWGTPYSLYHQPHNRRVAKRIGKASFLPAEITSDGKLNTTLGEFNLSPQQLQATNKNSKLVELLIRPDDLVYDPNSPYQAFVLSAIFLGVNIQYQLRLANGNILQAFMPSHQRFSCGEQIGIRLDCKHLVVFSL